MSLYDLFTGAWSCHEYRLVDLLWFFIYGCGLALAILFLFLWPYPVHGYDNSIEEILFVISAIVCGKMAWRKFGDFASHF